MLGDPSKIDVPAMTLKGSTKQHQEMMVLLNRGSEISIHVIEGYTFQYK